VGADAGQVQINGFRRRALLVRMLVSSNQVVSADHLAEDLWDSKPPPGARSTLSSHLSLLRRALGPDRIVSRGGGYAMVVEAGELDVSTFEQAASSGQDALRRGEWRRALDIQQGALDLWRGPALMDVAGAAWATPEIVRLENLRLSTTEACLDARLAIGDYANVVALSEAAVSEHPLRERFWAQLMVALYRSGRQAEALRAFQRLRDYLVDEVGIEPSAEIVALEDGILNQRDELGWRPAGLLITSAETPSSLPSPVQTYADLPIEVSELFGRDELIADTIGAVREHRLVTLWGAGGIGKSSLAIRIARTGSEFDDGVRFIDLSVLDGSDRVGEAVLTALHATASEGESSYEAVVRFLRPARLLLVLDNCEHLVAEIRELVARVLNGCPWVHILATSRESLAIRDEFRMAVPPLEVPEQSTADLEQLKANPCIRLFCNRARLADHTFSLDRESATSIGEICRRMNGLPFGIELVAARLDVESVSELASATTDLLQRLENELGERHQPSVLGSIRWSFDLLSELERQMFLAVAVFAGSFSRDMALRIVQAGEGSDRAFDRLVRTSMVVRTSQDSTRFRLFRHAKTFAQELMSHDEMETLRRRHAALLVERAQQIAPLVQTDDEERSSEILLADFPDFRQAVEYLMGRDLVEEAATLVVALFQFCLLHMISEVYGWAAKLVDALDRHSPLLTEVCGAAALGYWYEGDTDRAIDLGERAIRSVDFARQPFTFWAHMALIDAYGYAGRAADGFDHLRDFVAETKASGDPYWHICGLCYEAISYWLFDQAKSASERIDEAIVLARRLNNPDCTQLTLYCLGQFLLDEDPEAASEAFENAIDATRRVSSRWTLSLNLLALARARRKLEDTAGAAAALLEVLELLGGSGNRSQLSETFLESAYVLARNGDVELAFLAYQCRLGLPEMTRPYQDARANTEFGKMLESNVGPGRSRLAVRASAVSEHDMIIRCRSALESAVTSQPSEQTDYPRRFADVVVGCTDLVASTELNVEVGDERYRELLSEHNDIVRRRLNQFKGTEISFTGDGLLVMFEYVDDALGFAEAVQADLDQANANHPDSLLRVRIGMARGDVIESHDTFVGQTVVRAVRICAAATAGQVLVGEDVIETVASRSAVFEYVDTVPLKGFGVSVPLYRAVA
jgi:predicted ATPase/DNA-binding SARP family transcriptional activator/class 3 adenylate cyclase